MLARHAVIESTDMGKTDLQTFADIVARTGRITFGDAQRLHRDVLPDGVRSREDIEILIRLEASVRRYDRSFAGWLVANVVDYAVWGERPTGVVTDEIAAWLAGLLDADRPVLARIAREIARETQEVGGVLEEAVLQDAGMEAAMAAAGEVGGSEARV
ncbi:hypothetical protein ABEG18_02100 [Alsobacter sp. KACC 23698]|uniref:Uncharacterized protein n=1 Tax=Alsobacter sp. KACC 23698 TaxID=3149229 RepID=A0AAU7JHQ1_9HYPH